MLPKSQGKEKPKRERQLWPNSNSPSNSKDNRRSPQGCRRVDLCTNRTIHIRTQNLKPPNDPSRAKRPTSNTHRAQEHNLLEPRLVPVLTTNSINNTSNGSSISSNGSINIRSNNSNHLDLVLLWPNRNPCTRRRLDPLRRLQNQPPSLYPLRRMLDLPLHQHPLLHPIIHGNECSREPSWCKRVDSRFCPIP